MEPANWWQHERFTGLFKKCRKSEPFTFYSPIAGDALTNLRWCPFGSLPFYVSEKSFEQSDNSVSERLIYHAEYGILRSESYSQIRLTFGRVKSLIERKKYLDSLIRRQWNHRIKVITGIRRCGKSTLLFGLFREYLLASGVPENNIILLALDDDTGEQYRDPYRLSAYVVSA